ncbi:M23 family metallopeptidase [Burkholderia sp. 572]|uniref:M23 family metallopeptidase n=1 Tax=Burkholderia sp. 572 TaxID=3156414 RepID=UPI003397EFF2
MRSRRRLALGVVSCAVLLLGLTGTLEAASKRQSAALDATSAATRGASEPLAYETASVITRKSARLTLFDAALVSIGRQPVDQAVAAASLRDDLSAYPFILLSRDTSVLVSMCGVDTALCAVKPSGSGAAVATATPVEPTAVASAASAASRAATGSRFETTAFVLPEEDSGVRAGAIVRNLGETLKQADLPPGVAAQVLRIFDTRVNLKAGAHANDSYRILYERIDHGSAPTRRLRVSAVEIRLGGKLYRAAWFQAKGQKSGAYYAFDGQPLAAAPFVIPVSHQRISSPFGMRIHPVHGERHGHSGVDFAAPTGTPVQAASAGKVRFVGWEPGYGNYVVVQHPGGHTTWYAHLSAFEKGLRSGMPVTQGQRLGAVGSTGTATGPHLHFEVRANNVPIEPLGFIARTTPQRLAGEQRVAFNRTVQGVRTQFAALLATPNMASVEARAHTS